MKCTERANSATTAVVVSGPSHARLAVDIGGTFTDVAVEVRGSYASAKRLTTSPDPIPGVLSAVEAALFRAELAPSDVDVVLQHGTTLATNAIIERRGATVGLLTTAGFRDVLEIGYERRYDQYDLNSHHPEPLVPRERCYPVIERITSQGEVLAPLQADSVLAAVEGLREAGVDSVAVGFINAFANPAHEQAVAALLKEHAPDLPVSLSSEVSPEMREYDRLTTTVANAYILPLVTRLLSDFESALRAAGFSCPILMMTSAGGMASTESALRFPVRLLESGPAGGAVLAARAAARGDLPRALSFDMGGTTAKVCIIQDGQALRTRELEVGRASRMTKHSGLPIRIPSVDLIEIGSGGGSVARVEPFRGLVVGPESAGSVPGPACYGQGGERPTVTDADCVLGFLDPEGFGDGNIAIDRDLASGAIDLHLGPDLGLETVAAAQAVRDSVDEAMANAARVHAAERGTELTQTVLIAFGGNGPIHAADVAKKVGIRSIRVPQSPGVGSAIGFLCAPVSHEIIRSRYTLLADLDTAEVETLLRSMELEALEVVRSGLAAQPVRTTRSAFMRYRGQGHEIEVELGEEPLGPSSPQRLKSSYEHAYANLYGRVPPDMTIEIRNWAVAATTPGRDLLVTSVPRGGAATVATAAPVSKRWLHLPGGGCEVAVYLRDDLPAGTELSGPLLVTEAQSSTYVPENGFVTVADNGDLVISLGGR